MTIKPDSALGSLPGRRPADAAEGKLRSVRKGLSRALRWLLAVIWFVFRALVVAWATLAIYYSNLPWPELRLGLAVVFAAFAVWALWLSPRRRDRVAFILVFAGVVAWWIAIPPSHDRNWRPEVAVMPRAFIDGDRVQITGVRNFEYRSRNDFTVRYEERELSLSHLSGLDFYVSYWTEGLVGPHLRELHLRQRAAAEHLHRDTA